MKYSVSIHAVLRGEGLTAADKIRTAAALGFPAVEFWTWWDEDLDAVAAAGERSLVDFMREFGGNCA